MQTGIDYRELHRRLHSVVRQCVVIALLTLQSACVVFPVPILGETQNQYLKKQDRDSIEVRKSSREDVLAKLGSPTALSAKRQTWVYSTKQYKTTGWMICGFIIFPSGIEGAAPSADGGCPLTFDRNKKHQVLEVRFDDTGIVSRVNVASLDDGECTKAGFCWDKKPTFLSAEGRKTAPDWHCAVHLYSVGAAVSTKLEIVGPKTFDLSLTEDDFHMLLLQRWEPDILISFDDGSSHRLPVPCENASAHFVQFGKTRSGYSVKPMKEADSRQIIVNRQSLIALNL